ncbi:MAG TPA: HPr family phosphocarrier protein [Verrucomicrobiota bacterium]|nr:HPr family phosphocarrier protein [Verrucomicrobiota bacterium]HNU50727.1 HPr family phosphocarrier protein [Verrucomicrobiota bacterium]
MKTSLVVVRWLEGLHLRPASQVARLAQGFRSVVRFRVGSRVIDARSVLSILMLGATIGTEIDIEATGEDEDKTIAAMESLFQGPRES